MKKIIILVLAILFTATSCNKQQANKTPDSTNWDVYRYQLGGFEIQYPKGWQTFAPEDNTSSDGCVTFAYPSPLKLAGSGILGICYQKEFSLGDHLKNNITQTKKTTMGGLSATEMSINPSDDYPRIFVATDTPYNGLIYSMYLNKALKTDEQYTPIFQSMQTSLKFIK